MDYRETIQDIHKRRKYRRRKKAAIKILSVMAVLLIIAVMLYVIYINHNTSGGEYIGTPVSTTSIPTTVPTAAETTEPADTPAPTYAPTAEPTAPSAEETVANRGTWEPVPDNIKTIMRDCSLPQDASVTFDDLAYLTVPHYDFDYNITEGHMVVNAELADEVLDIFAELFNIQYPIECMQIVDYYDADDYLSIENNNTSAFNYRESTDGSGRLSKHALGCAIDINPQINPYVNSEGTGSHQNAEEYWSRDASSWSSDVAKAAYIGEDTEIYKIFIDHGWEWGGSWASYKDYQHFQKDIN